MIAIGLVTHPFFLDNAQTSDAAQPTGVVVGTVDGLFVAAGASVAADAPLQDNRVETVPAPSNKTGADGLITITRTKTVVTSVQVLSPAVSTLGTLSVTHGQSVAFGAVTSQIAPPSVSVSGSLCPEQPYRLPESSRGM